MGVKFTEAVGSQCSFQCVYILPSRFEKIGSKQILSRLQYHNKSLNCWLLIQCRSETCNKNTVFCFKLYFTQNNEQASAYFYRKKKKSRCTVVAPRKDIIWLSKVLPIAWQLERIRRWSWENRSRVRCLRVGFALCLVTWTVPEKDRKYYVATNTEGFNRYANTIFIYYQFNLGKTASNQFFNNIYTCSFL